MASVLGKSVFRVTSRSLANHSKSLTQKSLNVYSVPSGFSSPSSRAVPRASRILSVLARVESMMPLHSAIAAARLTSSIAADSSCWSQLSRGLEKTL